MHRRCAPEITNVLQKDGFSSDGNNSSCQYVVWINNHGLGNKLISIASSFLYALLANRVLLIDRGTDMEELFCEPFGNTSWLVPEEFSIKKFEEFNSYLKFDESHGFCNNESVSLQSRHAHVSIENKYDALGTMFFCERQQRVVQEQLDWLFLKTNLYFAPSLYSVPSFRAELERMFPEEQKAIFHHLGRYLFNPSDRVWEKTVRFYKDYLADSDGLVGLQFRIIGQPSGFINNTNSRTSLFEKALQCGLENNFLPRSNTPLNSTSVLVTSLDSSYYDNLRKHYGNYDRWSRVRIYSPSREGVQKTDTLEHDVKALMEMLLLSLGDEIVVSSASTFGYVAYGLAGVTPWILPLDKSKSCSRGFSIDPCLHAYVSYECECHVPKDAKRVQNNVRDCQDLPWGFNLKIKVKCLCGINYN